MWFPTSASTLGWQPSLRYRSACFISSPISSTVDVVPSLQWAETRVTIHVAIRVGLEMAFV